jgi:hypothetical protein
MNARETDYVFRMAKGPSALEPRLDLFVRELTVFVDGTGTIHNAVEFNSFLKRAGGIIARHQAELELESPLFDREIQSIHEGWEFRFPTPWGGVANKDLSTSDDVYYAVRKYLVIQQKGMLGFECHENKLEELQVLEGLCIGISSIHGAPGWEKGCVALTFMKPGDRCVMEPGDEHGIIALTNCVVEEKAKNDTGGDLEFIFPIHCTEGPGA